MIIVKDSMVLIHLAKTSLLRGSCTFFGDVIIPDKVFNETVKMGMEREHEDAMIINNLIREKRIDVKRVKSTGLMKRAYQFNIQRGEAESLALYWQEKADLLASDDDNVRKKKVVLEINLIGTPAIILALHRKKLINKEEVLNAIKRLRVIGWFSNTVLDSILLEVR